jgi:hypothetical protein
MFCFPKFVWDAMKKEIGFVQHVAKAFRSVTTKTAYLVLNFYRVVQYAEIALKNLI